MFWKGIPGRGERPKLRKYLCDGVVESSGDSVTVGLATRRWPLLAGEQGGFFLDGRIAADLKRRSRHSSVLHINSLPFRFATSHPTSESAVRVLD